MCKQKEKQTVKFFRSLRFSCGKLISDLIYICDFLRNKKKYV